MRNGANPSFVDARSAKRREKMDRKRLDWIISGLPRDDLSDGTWKFIESLEQYFNNHGDLTKYQEERLEEIFKEKGR